MIQKIWSKRGHSDQLALFSIRLPHNCGSGKDCFPCKGWPVQKSSF